jgi:hypothetical protein
MEAIYLVCGARGPQLMRDPLGGNTTMICAHRPPFPVLALATLVTGTSCVASWGAIVKYSDVPAPAEEGVVAGVYRAALENVVQPFVLEDSLSIMQHLAGEQVVVEHDSQADPFRAPGYWDDSLAHEVEAAFAHAMFLVTASRDVILGLSPEPGLRTESRDRRRERDRVWLSDIGFNEDSTIAVVRIIHANYYSAFDAVLMLARRPGYRWKVFKSLSLGGWIS